MGGFSLTHWLIFLVVVVVIFGTNKLKNAGKDLGQAVKGFKDAVQDETKTHTQTTHIQTPENQTLPHKTPEHKTLEHQTTISHAGEPAVHQEPIVVEKPVIVEKTVVINSDNDKNNT